MAIGAITYDDTTRREDLVDVLTNISPDDTPLLSSFKSVSVSNTLHEYLQDTLAAGGDNAQVEAVAYTVADPTQPTRLNNNTQVFADFVQVSETQMVVDHAGMTDPMKYQITKQLKEHAKDKPLNVLTNLAKSVKATALDLLAYIMLPFVCYANTEERLAI